MISVKSHCEESYYGRGGSELGLLFIPDSPSSLLISLTVHCTDGTRVIVPEKHDRLLAAVIVPQNWLWFWAVPASLVNRAKLKGRRSLSH